ncbi:MAG: MopE-related protein, partial [Candidatus Woesearchaeota archaeon]
MKSDSFKLGLVSFVAVVAITVMAFLSSFNIEGYYGYAARQKGTIGINPGLSFEAESGIINGFITIEDNRASGKMAIYSPNGSGNASYQVNIERDGLYRVAVKAATPLSYSPENFLYVELNGQRVLLNVERSNNYKWVTSKNHTGWVLRKGQRTLNIQSLSPDIRIDSVSLSYITNECQDNDGDGYGRPGSELCTYPQTDCNDLDANINPGAVEVCNGKDDNCNRNIDEGCPGACVDEDNDGYGNNCANGNDCDDSDSNVFEFKSCKYNGNICGEFVLCANECPTPPQEICNNKIDDNCNGLVDEDCTQDFFYENTFIEAENGVLNGFLVSNGYVYTPSDSANSVSYTFNVVKAGEYVVYTRLVNPDASTNSFYVSLNEGNVQGNEAYTYDAKTGQGMVDDYVRLRGPNGNITYAQYDPKIYLLTPGEYTLTFYGRERNTKLDALALMDASTYQFNNTNTTVNNSNVTYQDQVFVSRSFSVNPVNVNGTVTVFLSVSGSGVLLVDEYVPDGVVIVDAGSGVIPNNNLNNIRFFDLNAGPKVFNYTVRVLSGGSFVFNGEYSFNGSIFGNITGEKTLNTQFICSDGQNQSCTT